MKKTLLVAPLLVLLTACGSQGYEAEPLDDGDDSSDCFAIRYVEDDGWTKSWHNVGVFCKAEVTP